MNSENELGFHPIGTRSPPLRQGNIKNPLSFIALPIEQYIPHMIEKRYSRLGILFKKYLSSIFQ
jgi:hypothetical protein